MKKLILFLILIPSFVFAGTNPYIIGIVSPATSTTLSAHFENSNDVTVGTPAGSSAGDSVFTLFGSAAYTTDANKVTDGTYALNCPGASDYLQLDNSNEDIFNSAEGSLVFDFGIETFASQTRLIEFKDGTLANWLFVYMTGSTPGAVDIYVWYNAAGGSTQGFYLTPNLTEGTNRYTLVITWNPTLGSQELFAELFNFGSTSITSNSTATITAMTVNAINQINVGNSGTAAGSVSVDNLQIKATYDKTDWR